MNQFRYSETWYECENTVIESVPDIEDPWINNKKAIVDTVCFHGEKTSRNSAEFTNVVVVCHSMKPQGNMLRKNRNGAEERLAEPRTWVFR